MGFRNGAYASVFGVKKGTGNFYDVNLATSHKDKNTGEYTTDFRGFVRFIGDAGKVVARYAGQSSKSPICRIKLGSVDTTNTYNKEKNVTYTNHVVFSCEVADGSSHGGSSNNQRDIANYVNSMPSMSADEEALFT